MSQYISVVLSVWVVSVPQSEGTAWHNGSKTKLSNILYRRKTFNTNRNPQFKSQNQTNNNIPHWHPEKSSSYPISDRVDFKLRLIRKTEVTTYWLREYHFYFLIAWKIYLTPTS